MAHCHDRLGHEKDALEYYEKVLPGLTPGSKTYDTVLGRISDLKGELFFKEGVR